MSENENKTGLDEIKESVSAEIQSENISSDKTAPVRKSRAKIIVSILLGVLTALIAVVLLVLWQIDRVAATATRTVGSAITGTAVDVQSIFIRPLAGSVKVTGFTVGNPEGFHNPVAIKVGNFHVAVNTASVMTDKIVVEHLELSDVAIDFEYSFSNGSNLDALLKNVEKNTGADKKKAVEKPEEEKEPAQQKQVVIRKLILKDSKVTVSSKTLGTTMSIPLIPIEMENVGEGSDLAGAIHEVLMRIVSEITKVVNIDTIGKGISSGVDSVSNAAGNAVNQSVDFIKKLPGLNIKK